jgi:RNA polymerase sigma factor (sigma-70 family)
MQPEAISGLVAAASAGDPTAWERLCPAVAGWVTAVAAGLGLARDDAADVNQVVCLRLVTHLDRLNDPAALRGWVVTVARHECYRVLRDRHRRAADLDPESADVADRWAPAADERLLRTERQRELHAAINQLSMDCQRLLRLLSADPPLSYADVATVLERPIGAIGPTRQRCLARLREILEAVEAPAADPPVAAASVGAAPVGGAAVGGAAAADPGSGSGAEPAGRLTAAGMVRAPRAGQKDGRR